MPVMVQPRSLFTLCRRKVIFLLGLGLMLRSRLMNGIGSLRPRWCGGGIHFRDKSAGDTAAGDGGDFDFDVWTCVVLLIMSLHMPAMDRRDGDESRWRGMTPVLDCMGFVDPWLGNTEPSYALARVVLSFSIEYIDWCIMHDASRKYYLGIFSRLERIWRSPGSCPYVHCKSGRGSSAATMYAQLRLRFGLSSHDAWAALQFRVGQVACGKSVAQA